MNYTRRIMCISLLVFAFSGSWACADSDSEPDLAGNGPSSDAIVVNLEDDEIVALCESVRPEESEMVECGENSFRVCMSASSCVSEVKEYQNWGSASCVGTVEEFEACHKECTCLGPPQCERFSECLPPPATD